jgi:2-keto-4-pentenoate hydratase/2-oxohepta-3-ene-1,7-dioic acid hydratase in catechol pathway
LIARYLDGGSVRFGVVGTDTIRPIAAESLPPPEELLTLGAASLASRTADTLRLEEPVLIDGLDLMAPVPRPSKIICIGTNYRAHAAEHGVSVPEYPEVFAKFPSALLDPGASVCVNPLDPATDYEGELCVVIGRKAKGLSRDVALEAVAGYAVANDISARTWQLRVSQWVMGKTFDTFCPVGPWLATAESVPDPQGLQLQTHLNGDLVQDASTEDMVFPVADLIAYLSSVMTLEPGDLILTGTPEGVGFHRRPQRLLAPGDVISVSIESIGTLTNPVVAAG